MPSSTNTALYFIFTWLWGLCYGFVLLSSATGAGGFPKNVFEPGSAWLYDYRSSVLLNEKGHTEKDVGFMVNGDLQVESVWGNSEAQRLLKFQFLNSHLQIRSRKSAAPEGFAKHSSQLDSLPQTPFLVEWKNGKIQKIHLVKNEPTSIANLKKGIASLFQFQLKFKDTVSEIDSSGKCRIRYTVEQASQWFKKIKETCSDFDLPHVKSPEPVLSPHVESFREADYALNQELTFVQSIHYIEGHAMSPATNENAGNSLEAQQLVMLKAHKIIDVIEGDSFEDVVAEISNKLGATFTQESLQLEREIISTEDSITLAKLIKEYKENLKTKSVGSLESAKIIPKVIAVTKLNSKNNIVKALELKKSQSILHQLYDILGHVQTEASHAAVMHKLSFDDTTKDDLLERYLWALSMSSHPNPDIISDLISRYRKTSKMHTKVKETLLMTLGSMAYRLSKKSDFEYHLKVYNNVEEILLYGLNTTEDKHSFLRALRNLRSANAIPELLKVTALGAHREQVLAWKALAVLEKSQISTDLLKTAFTTFFQLKKLEDSSSRTLALDIILEQDISDDTLNQILQILLGDPNAYEVQQYLMQRLKMIAENNPEFNKRLLKIIQSNKKINNYGVLAQKGLSIALSRSFLQHTSSNGSLITLQEIQNGIVKRGTVDVVIGKGNVSKEIFSLGIFSGGLQSFVASDSDSTETDDTATATAGIELSVLGTQIRPFVFFDGQGELMGHVWSGTASEKTTAFQALTVLHDHLEYIPLAPGFIAEINLKGTASFDLSGNIAISLWNRNAVSLVEKAAGINIIGQIKLDTSFIRLYVEFNLSVEPKLNLNTDLDFSSNLGLCMRLSQPDLIYRHNVFKVERVSGSKHKIRKATYRKYLIPGKTYALNRKNNEMCNVIFNR